MGMKLPSLGLLSIMVAGLVVPLKDGTCGPLHDAAKTGDDKLIQRLLDDGADIEARDDKGWTPLHIAAQADQPKSIWVLFHRGANLDAPNPQVKNMTPLHLAVDNKNVRAAHGLLDLGANPNARSMWDLTPLHAAMTTDEPILIDSLLKYGADIEAKGFFNVTPLLFSSFFKFIQTKKLIKEGADVNARMRTDQHKKINFHNKEIIEGAAIIHLTAGSGNIELTQLLLTHGANVNIKTDYGRTPLHFAARMNKINTVEHLLQSGADPSHKDNDGKTALDYAQEKSHLEIVRLLNGITFPHPGN